MFRKLIPDAGSSGAVVVGAKAEERQAHDKQVDQP